MSREEVMSRSSSLALVSLGEINVDDMNVSCDIALEGFALGVRVWLLFSARRWLRACDHMYIHMDESCNTEEI